MSIALLLSLAGLALLDSTSVGTLFIPVWLLLAPGRTQAGRVLIYLAVLAAFYFALGLLIIGGAGAAAETIGAAWNGRAAVWVQLAAGVGLFGLSIRFDPKRRKGREGISRWRERVTTGSSSIGWLVGLALLAALAEIATMLPYLGAIAMLAASDLGAATVTALLAAYCLIMVLPAGMLLLARLTVASRIEPILRRLNTWITEKGAGATGWLLAIAGFLVARDAVARLWFLD
ncbi:GAP family protein [Actinopolymorpha alba]|uniref:GAP family protein n=1 Tax=Actinopolymorpha alba TaxID=533267 RepID=UPI00036A9884|nr:GAP family protein [Actinopolymorpha alba]